MYSHVAVETPFENAVQYTSPYSWDTVDIPQVAHFVESHFGFGRLGSDTVCFLTVVHGHY